MVRPSLFRFQLATALRTLTLLLCCAPLAAHSQLVWDPESESDLELLQSDRASPGSGIDTAPAPQPVSFGLSWGPDAEPTPLVVSDPALKPQEPLPGAGQPPATGSPEPVARQPQLSPDDLAALLLEPYSPPSLSGGLPSAYVANWGDFYFVGSTSTGSKRRDDIDAVFNAGIGFGDDVDLVAVELRWNMASFKNFNANGSFDVAMGRILVNQPRLQVGVAGGIFDVYAYRQAPSGESIPPPTGFGVITMAVPLREPNFRFNQVMQISFGLGGRDFAFLDDNFNGPYESLFGAIGVELTPNLGISAGISGRGTNLSLSYSPFRDLPIGINLLAADVFDQSPDGTVGVLSVSWGDNFRRGLF